MSKVEEVTVKFSQELEALATEIKDLIAQSAEAKIRIGELLNENKKQIEHGGMLEFYKLIGMSPRTAQTYMKIANNDQVQEMKAEGKLEGLNMSRILEMIRYRVNTRGDAKAKIEHVLQNYEKFDYQKCKSTAVLKMQYEDLKNTVMKLKKELKDYKQ